MIHYHGTPITPRAKLVAELPGRCFCVSFAAPGDIEVCHEIGQSVMLDNGAYSIWRAGHGEVDLAAYAKWVAPWLDYRTTWCVIPDMINGSEGDNDLLLSRWFKYRLPHDQCAPVWHMHESLERLRRLCVDYSKVCIGSSDVYSEPNSPRWRSRMEEAMDAVCGNGPAPTWLHMLRAMKQASGGPYPFASADSTNLARNHAGAKSHGRPARSLRNMADEVDGRQSAPRWRVAAKPLQFGTGGGG